MFSRGDNCLQGFGLRDALKVSTAYGVHVLKLSCHIWDLSAGRSVVGFVKTNGDAFIIRTNEGSDGGKQSECQSCLSASM